MAVIDENKKVQSSGTYPQLPGVVFPVDSGSIDCTAAGADYVILTVPANGNYRFIATKVISYTVSVTNYSSGFGALLSVPGKGDITVMPNTGSEAGRFWVAELAGDAWSAGPGESLNIAVAQATADALVVRFYVTGFYAPIP